MDANTSDEVFSRTLQTMDECGNRSTLKDIDSTATDDAVDAKPDGTESCHDSDFEFADFFANRFVDEGPHFSADRQAV